MPATPSPVAQIETKPSTAPEPVEGLGPLAELLDRLMNDDVDGEDDGPDREG